MKNLFKKEKYQGCSVYIDEADFQSIEDIKSKIDFFIENVRKYSQGITINLVNYFPDKENISFLIEISEYVKRIREKTGDIFLSIIVKLSDLSCEVASAITENEICWSLIVEPNFLKSDNLENYLNIRIATGHLNHGIIYYFDSQNKSYVEAFKEAHNSFYGFPISILPDSNVDLVKFNNDYYDFIKKQKDKLLNYKINEFESFISGNNQISNLFCYGFKENTDLRRTDYEAFCPTIRYEQLFYNSLYLKPEYLIGNITDGFDVNRINELLRQEAEIDSFLKKQKFVLNAERLILESRDFGDVIKKHDDFLYEHLCSKI